MDWRIKSYDEVSSTQDIIKQKSNESEGLYVEAKRQTAGRGRQARQWVSQEGNLFCSILLKPKIKLEHVGQLSLLIGVSLAQTIKPWLNHKELKLKWPNDVLIEGKKCAGILIETDISKNAAIEYIAAGIGVNIVDTPEEGAALNVFAEPSIELLDFRDSLLSNLAVLYEDWQNVGFRAIKQQWLNDAHEIDEDLSVHIQKDKKISGKFKGLDESGALLLKTENGIQTITAGDVEI